MFTKKHLRNGDYVKLRNGKMGIYIINGGFINNARSLDDRGFLNNLTNKNHSDFDIVEVRRFDNEVVSICTAFRNDYNEKIIYKRIESKLWNGMTYEEAHRALWNALADGEVKEKWEWFGLNNKNNEAIPMQTCFACQIASDTFHRSPDSDEEMQKCNFCPLCNIDGEQNCLNGLYDKWREAKGFERFKLAHEIAHLPWKEK